MRDIALTLLLVVLLVMVLKRAAIGAYLWAWLSLMNPQRMTYGFAYSVPWAQFTAIATLAGFVFSRDRKPLPLNGGVVLLLMLWVWMTITSVFALSPAEVVWERWIFISKTFLMLLITLMLLRGRPSLERLIWVVVLSIGYFGVKGGIFTLATGGTYRVWGPPSSMLEENNALAVALLTVLPLFYYLQHVATRRWFKAVLLLVMLSIGASILGSQSRGALLALLSIAAVLGLKSRHPVRVSLFLVAVVGLGIVFMPETWSDRMNSIQSYQDDDSALSRIYTWHTLWNLAVERPFVGGGFHSDTIAIFDRFAPPDSRYDGLRGTAWVAHSIYMQALGEHGFVGLALYLSIWIWVWVAAARVARKASRVPPLANWLPLLMRMCQVSVVGFCAGGFFLSLMLLDLPYYLLAFVTLGQCVLRDHQTSAPSEAPAAAVALPAAPPT